MTPTVETATTVAEVRTRVIRARSQGCRIGLVPTMGALHEGHASLIRAAVHVTDYVVVSIFVNPTQFGPNEDYSRYPRTFEADQSICAQNGASLIFAPAVEEMYPPDSTTFVEVQKLGDHLCGPSRPGHFRGVCTIVMKLLQTVLPDVAVFGAKDGQQARIIRQMVQDLNVPTVIKIEPTVREADGLAMSSRNRYLSVEERAHAPAIYQALLDVRKQVQAGEQDAARLEAELTNRLGQIPGSRIDYAKIVDEQSLQPVDRVTRPTMCAVAVFLGTTRLIDNIILS